MLNRINLLIGVVVAAIIPIAAIAWWLASPLFIDKTVNEELPFATSSLDTTSMANQEMTDAMADESSAEAMPDSMSMTNGDTMMDKSSDAMAMDKMDDAMAIEKSDDVMAMDKPEDSIMAKSDDAMAMEKLDDAIAMDKMEGEDNQSDAMMSESATAALLKEGSFRDADDFHRGSGTASIYRGPDGSRLLRLEDFNVTNGPDLRVILSTHGNPTTGDHVTSDGYIELGNLKGNQGNQNYEIPDDVDISAFNSIVIYCKPFHIIFSVASLEGVG